MAVRDNINTPVAAGALIVLELEVPSGKQHLQLFTSKDGRVSDVVHLLK